MKNSVHYEMGARRNYNHGTGPYWSDMVPRDSTKMGDCYADGTINYNTYCGWEETMCGNCGEEGRGVG